MTETPSIRIDPETNQRLASLAERTKRSKSFLAAEAIAAYLENEAWQLSEIQLGIDELDAGKGVSHERVKGWLNTWGQPSETKAPR